MTLKGGEERSRVISESGFVFYLCVTNYHQFRGLSNTYSLAQRLWVWAGSAGSSAQGLTGLQPRCQPGCIPSGAQESAGRINFPVAVELMVAFFLRASNSESLQLRVSEHQGELLLKGSPD